MRHRGFCRPVVHNARHDGIAEWRYGSSPCFDVAGQYPDSSVDVIGGQRFQTGGLAQDVQRGQRVVRQHVVLQVSVGCLGHAHNAIRAARYGFSSQARGVNLAHVYTTWSAWMRHA
jgi:hypothetical protein